MSALNQFYLRALMSVAALCLFINSATAADVSTVVSLIDSGADSAQIQTTLVEFAKTAKAADFMSLFQELDKKKESSNANLQLAQLALQASNDAGVLKHALAYYAQKSNLEFFINKDLQVLRDLLVVEDQEVFHQICKILARLKDDQAISLLIPITAAKEEARRKSASLALMDISGQSKAKTKEEWAAWYSNAAENYQTEVKNFMKANDDGDIAGIQAACAKLVRHSAFRSLVAKNIIPVYQSEDAALQKMGQSALRNIGGQVAGSALADLQFQGKVRSIEKILGGSLATGTGGVGKVLIEESAPASEDQTMLYIIIGAACLGVIVIAGIFVFARKEQAVDIDMSEVSADTMRMVNSAKRAGDKASTQRLVKDARDYRKKVNPESE